MTATIVLHWSTLIAIAMAVAAIYLHAATEVGWAATRAKGITLRLFALAPLPGLPLR